MSLNKKGTISIILYILCLYDIYLYLPDIFDLFKLDIEPPTTDYLLYFDAAMLLVGGIVTGIMLMRTGGKFNRVLGLVIILMNVVLTPLFIFKALP
jgi:uncharacterized membrane protein HdeD (DUF308 family)